MLENLQELKSQVESCRKCELCQTRTNIVFGVGSPETEVLFVGEGPGKNEDEQGEPFVGRSGQLLDKMLEYIGLSRKHNIYIANIVKCRPPENRDPSQAESEACIGYLRNQVRIIKPKIIVCLGRVAATRIISPDFKVTKEHGRFIERSGVLLMGTFHPAALLRNPNQKPAAMQDFLTLKAKIAEVCSPEFQEQIQKFEEELNSI